MTINTDVQVDTSRTFSGKRSISSGRIAKGVVKLLASLVILFLLYRQINLKNMLGILSQISPLYLLLITFLYLCGQIMSAFKWGIFLREAEIPYTKAMLIRAYFSGMFVNTFGLGTVGGDVTRALVIQPPIGKRAASLATVVADRMMGLSVLLSIGVIAIVAHKPEQLGDNGLLISLLAITGLASAWIFGPRLLTMIFPDGHRFSEAAKSVSAAFPKHNMAFLRAITISVFFHILQIGMHWVIAQEVAPQLNFLFLCATIPLVNTAAALPITWQGVGVRESLYILFFSPMGVSNEQAIVIGAIWILSATAVSALGGLFSVNALAFNRSSQDLSPAGQKMDEADENIRLIVNE